MIFFFFFFLDFFFFFFLFFFFISFSFFFVVVVGKVFWLAFYLADLASKASKLAALKNSSFMC